jgi:membrane protein
MATSANLRSVIALASDRVRDDQLGVHAGSLTYGAFLAIPPLLVLGLTALSIVLANDPTAQQHVIDSVTKLIPGLDEVIHTQFDQASAQQVGVGAVGVLVLLWAVSSFAVRVRTALGVIFRTGTPTLLAGRISGTGLGLLVVTGLAVYATAITQASGLDVPWWTRVAIDAVIGVAGIALALLVYWSLTPGPVKPTVRQHLPGAIALLVMGVALERLGALYVTHVVARTTALYGAIGAIFGLFAFLYLAMWAFLAGAELSEIVRERRPEML